jgi:hypothetical protein
LSVTPEDKAWNFPKTRCDTAPTITSYTVMQRKNCCNNAVPYLVVDNLGMDKQSDYTYLVPGHISKRAMPRSQGESESDPRSCWTWPNDGCLATLPRRRPLERIPSHPMQGAAEKGRGPSLDGGIASPRGYKASLASESSRFGIYVGHACIRTSCEYAADNGREASSRTILPADEGRKATALHKVVTMQRGGQKHCNLIYQIRASAFTAPLGYPGLFIASTEWTPDSSKKQASNQ